MKIYEIEKRPTVADYLTGLNNLGNKVSEQHRELLKALYRFPDRTATTVQLAKAVGASRYNVVNQKLGRLGRLFCEEMGIEPDSRPDDTARWWKVWSRGWQAADGFRWQMLEEVAEAIESIGWVERQSPFPFPEEVHSMFREGERISIVVNRYERDPRLRQLAILIHGVHCSVCRMDFKALYGDVAEGLIHVHHLQPLASVRIDHEVEPYAELRPVCPNCHAVIHRRTPPYSIEEVRAMLRPLRCRQATSPSMPQPTSTPTPTSDLPRPDFRNLAACRTGLPRVGIGVG